MAKASNAETATNIEILLTQLAGFESTITQLDNCIAKMSELPKYAKQAAALSCFRGVGVLSAMTFLIEIGDARRFSHPRKLSSYAGFSVREYSSGGKREEVWHNEDGQPPSSHRSSGGLPACRHALHLKQTTQSSTQGSASTGD